MPNEYEKKTREELHNIQTKLNKTKDELEMEILIMQDYQGLKEKREKRESFIMGLFLIFGVLILNIFSPLSKNIDFLSFNFNPKVGPIDIILFLAGLRFIWRGIRK